jgi:hypothetical protein
VNYPPDAAGITAYLRVWNAKTLKAFDI